MSWVGKQCVTQPRAPSGFSTTSCLQDSKSVSCVGRACCSHLAFPRSRPKLFCMDLLLFVKFINLVWLNFISALPYELCSCSQNVKKMKKHLFFLFSILQPKAIQLGLRIKGVKMITFWARINFYKMSYFSRLLRWPISLSEQSCKVINVYTVKLNWAIPKKIHNCYVWMNTFRKAIHRKFSKRHGTLLKGTT